MLGVWLFGGLISLCGALSVAELAASLPQTGGWYVYLREGWGRLTGFLFGWAELVLIRASASGAIATVFSEYFLRSIGYDPATNERATDYVAAAAIVVAGAPQHPRRAARGDHRRRLHNREVRRAGLHRARVVPSRRRRAAPRWRISRRPAGRSTRACSASR